MKKILVWYNYPKWKKWLDVASSGFSHFGNFNLIYCEVNNDFSTKTIDDDFILSICICNYNDINSIRLRETLRKRNIQTIYLSDGCFFDYFKRLRPGWDKCLRYPWSVFINGSHNDDKSIRKYEKDLPVDRLSRFNPEIKLKKWRRRGKNIVLATQRGTTVEGKDMDSIYSNIIDKILKLTDRPIILRLFPVPDDQGIEKIFKEKIVNRKDCYVIHPKYRNSEMFPDVHCMVTHSSKISGKSILHGVPCITQGLSISEPVSEKRIEKIECPRMPDRKSWRRWLTYCHWDISEMSNGEPWKFFADNGYLKF